MLRTLFAALVFTISASVAAQDAVKPSGLPRTKSPVGVELYFIGLADGANVARDFTVRFGLKGMGVAPAGTTKEGTGHHHLLVDVASLPALDLPLPNDVQHKHFGNGQTEVALSLEPGDHTLQLILGDAAHIPFDPPILSAKITVHVK